MLLRRTFRYLSLVLFALLLFSTVVRGLDWKGAEMEENGNTDFYKPRSLEEVLSRGSEKCTEKPCVQSEQCCPGDVCVDTTKRGHRQVAGTCLPIYGVNGGATCLEDVDCEPGLRCLAGAPPAQLIASSISGLRQLKSCQALNLEMTKKQYNDECSSSTECDTMLGLCCQQIKRHRMAPRRACLYFTSPASCIGHVDGSFARPMAVSSLHYTPNEQDYFRARIG